MFIDRMNLPDKRSGATVILFPLEFDNLRTVRIYGYGYIYRG